MRAIRVASAALLGLTALTLSAPAAVASDDVTPFGFSVMPSTVAAGGQVTLHVNRDGDGCRGPVTVSSAVFDTVRIPARHTTATATVDRDARPGAVYLVTFGCARASGSTSLTIAGGHPQPYPPHRGVHAGAGGSIAGFDLKEIGLGAALVAGSLGVAYRFARGRAGEGGA
ncbi:MULTISPECIES: hypothetical protein [unclassified Streptomyces]|uniref:hypothetical protein n=1 Tax=unclassified Streptomyces TaxID=2593676 RepID=UPI003D72F8E4